MTETSGESAPVDKNACGGGSADVPAGSSVASTPTAPPESLLDALGEAVEQARADRRTDGSRPVEHGVCEVCGRATWGVPPLPESVVCDRCSREKRPGQTCPESGAWSRFAAGSRVTCTECYGLVRVRSGGFLDGHTYPEEADRG